MRTIKDAIREVEQTFALAKKVRRAEMSGIGIDEAHAELDAQRENARLAWEEAHSPEGRLLHNAREALALADKKIVEYENRNAQTLREHPGLLGEDLGIDSLGMDADELVRTREIRTAALTFWHYRNGYIHAMRDMIRLLDSCDPVYTIGNPTIVQPVNN